MATKIESKESKILAIFVKEYKYEGVILLIAALLAIVFGFLVLEGHTGDGSGGLVINPNVPVLGDYPLAFAWILIILGFFSLILCVWPFIKPSIGEITKISWISTGELMKNSLIVFVFIVVMAFMFLLYDLALKPLVELLAEIKG